MKPVKPMKANTKYEELKCIGFYPDRDLLEAVIDVKLPYGYKGNLCSAGSFEHVRFFVDWDGDGDFTDAGEDVGIASVNVHDIFDGEKVCLDKTKPDAEITGKFKATDQHFWRYRLTVLPYPPSTNDKFKHRPLPALEYIYGEEPAYPTLPASGVTNGTFELDTLGMKPCGYVIYLYVWDRTIINNHMQGNQKSASVGFCLLEEK